MSNLRIPFPVAFACVPLALACPLASAAVPTYHSVELQARSNLLVNDPGWNLPPGSSFNSISASINDSRIVTFPVQIVPINGDQGNTGPGLWHGSHGVGGIVVQHESPVDGISANVSINADGDVVAQSIAVQDTVPTNVQVLGIDDLNLDGVWLVADGVERTVNVSLCPPMLRGSVGV